MILYKNDVVWCLDDGVKLSCKVPNPAPERPSLRGCPGCSSVSAKTNHLLMSFDWNQAAMLWCCKCCTRFHRMWFFICAGFFSDILDPSEPAWCSNLLAVHLSELRCPFQSQGRSTWLWGGEWDSAVRQFVETCGKIWNVVLPGKLPEAVSGEAAAELLVVWDREKKHVVSKM